MTPSGYPGTRGQKQSGMIGQRFERLVVLSYDEEASKLKGLDCYRVECNCGKESVVSGNFLRNGNTKSCGCLARKMSSERMSKMSQVGANNPNYLHSFVVEAKKFRKDVRMRDVVCQICGTTDKESLIKYGERLSAHHLDGDRYNNDLKNGALLCKQDHMTVTRGDNTWRL